MPLLDAIGDNAGLLAKRDDNGFMNKLSLAVPGAAKPKPAAGKADAQQSPEERACPQRPEPHPSGAAASAGRQAAGDRPDGGNAEEAVRQGLIPRPACTAIVASGARLRRRRAGLMAGEPIGLYDSRTSCFREDVMENLTVSMDDYVDRSEIRVQAAKSGKSVSRIHRRCSSKNKSKMDRTSEARKQRKTGGAAAHFRRAHVGCDRKRPHADRRRAQCRR